MLEYPGIGNDPDEATEYEFRNRECMVPVHDRHQPSAAPFVIEGIDSIRCDQDIDVRQDHHRGPP